MFIGILVGGFVIFYFPIYWVSNHPNWLSYFSEGWPNHQPVYVQTLLFFFVNSSLGGSSCRPRRWSKSWCTPSRAHPWRSWASCRGRSPPIERLGSSSLTLNEKGETLMGKFMIIYAVLCSEVQSTSFAKLKNYQICQLNSKHFERTDAYRKIPSCHARFPRNSSSWTPFPYQWRVRRPAWTLAPEPTSSWWPSLKPVSALAPGPVMGGPWQFALDFYTWRFPKSWRYPQIMHL